MYNLLAIIGSLGLFLFGMKTMSDGIQNAAGDRLQTILNFMTGNRISAVLTGFLITILVQSSSASTVMVVSFVNASLLSLTQAIGVIMGANIGTTVTGWIIAILGFKVNISAIALPIVGLGAFLLFYKKLNKRDWGEALIGFGLLFMGLLFLREYMPDIESHPEMLAFLQRFTDMGFLSFVLFILIGTLLTVLVQSSSAAMAITLTMAYSGWIDYPTAAAIILGENIGTTVTANLASIGTGVNARRTARAHLLFNIFGILWMSIVFYPFLHLVDYIVPGAMFKTGNTFFLPGHLAMFHTLFNICNTLLCLPFIQQLSKLTFKMVPEEPQGEKPIYSLTYLSASIQDTPGLYLVKAKEEIAKMASITGEMFTKFIEVFYNPDINMGEKVEALKQMEDYTDQMQEELSRFLVLCSADNLNTISTQNVNALIRIVHELERIGDSCYNLILLAERRYRKKMDISSKAMEELKPYADLVEQFITFIQEHLNRHLSTEEMQEAQTLEQRIDKQRDSLKKASRKRLKKGANIKGELMFIDIVNHIEHIGDYSLNIAQALRKLT